jgi:triacylglycerol esterase/lipase EstA (alpha/beta hydrolase family)
MTHVAVLVPGIMGSELRLGSTVVWPGSLEELVLPYGKMKELLRDDLVATDIIRKFSISHQYDDLIRDLGTCGFAESSNPPTLYVLPYDWRKANELAAKLLADLVDKAVSERDDADVTLIGHSMGGLVCRFYLESGSFTTRTGFSRVRNLVTLGTPHRGAPLALTAAVGLERRLFLNADQVLQLASDPRYPSLYQLLPPAS